MVVISGNRDVAQISSDASLFLCAFVRRLRCRTSLNLKKGLNTLLFNFKN